MLGVALRLALREMRRNIMRSVLTMLGIIIGVAAVIVLVTLGSGATRQVTQQIANLGSNLLMVSVGKRMGPGQSSTAPAFKLADAEALAREAPALAAVAPQASSASTAIFANENWGTTVTGSTEQYFTVNNRQLAEGRIFTGSEARSGAAVCVIGETVRVKLFAGQSPLGAKMRLRKLSCEIVGLLKPKGQSTMGSDQDDIVIVPLRTFQRRIAGNDDVSLIQVSAKDDISTDAVKQELQRLLRIRRHLSADEDDNFNVMDMKEIATMLSGTTQMMTGLLGAVAAVSLLVGGIGIMNIMLVSVTERTREIGIRLAIGALENEILLQFLVEAVVLSSSGGLIGIALALVSSSILAAVLQVPLVFNLPVIAIAFVFSATVGIVFGYVPARKAARMDPIEALRHE
ncbi:putative ABC transport system permease protein [Methylobacter tundripaludum]|uniref:Putative ABC transport system permease protein n=1 Tax=Methylobacter tundripaludum TaxID=173365 RepID=A0A2S6GP03_9GAMM|nr:ABC transporter permease [Methylobacter tundripaludum]PPK66916.1 putative ABC transport system permease protein [Methylobacter tundripaludum]